MRSYFIIIVCIGVSAFFSLFALLVLRLTIFKKLSFVRIVLLTVAISVAFGGTLSFLVIRSSRSDQQERWRKIARLGCVRIETSDLGTLNRFFEKKPFDPGIYRIAFNPGSVNFGLGEEETVDLFSVSSPSKSPWILMKALVEQLQPVPCP